jgi:hypothetical protein
MWTKVNDLNHLPTEALLSNLYNSYCTTSLNLLYQEIKNFRHALLLNVLNQLSVDLNDGDFI